MKNRENYLAKRLDDELQKQGYSPECKAGRQSSIDAKYSHPRGIALHVEYKILHIYRAAEFQGLIGDAILRFQKEASPGRRLMLAFLFSRMSRNAERDLRSYADRFLPDLQWLLLADDGRGRMRFEGRGHDVGPVEPLHSHEGARYSSSHARLFSPKSQWLWKLLLLPGLNQRHWAGPQHRPRSINELAELSGVSQPVASSFIRRAEEAGFVRRISSGFIVERHRELLDDWVYAIKHGRRKEMALQFVYPDEAEEKWLGKVRSFCRPPKSGSSRPPVAVGSHLACHLLGMGRSNVRLPWLYAGAQPAEIMSALDLAPAEAVGGRVSLVIPSSPESVFGGCVRAGGIPVVDALQCYLDVRLSHARGMEQDESIMDRILRPHFERRM